MRSTSIAIVVLACGTAAAGTPRDTGNDLLRHLRDGAGASLFADKVELGAMWFADPDCAARFDKPMKLAGSFDGPALADCLRANRPKAAEVVHGTIALRFQSGLLIAVTTDSDGAITKLGYFDTVRADAQLPTIEGDCRHETAIFEFQPSGAVVNQIVKRGIDANATIKICLDADGNPGKPRVVAASKYAAFDKEAAAYTSKMMFGSIKLGGTAVAACELFTFNAYAEGVEGGVVGGDPDWCDAAPAMPPPPPAPPQNVPPTVLEAQRIAGDKLILPDEATKKQIVDSGKTRVVGSFKLCVDVQGAIASVSTLKSTGFPAYDKLLRDGMQTWQYKPFAVNGRAVPVCTAVTFIYSP